MKIDENIINKTDCKKNFACLDNTDVCCKITNCVNNQIYFVDCKDKKYCNFKKFFGNSNYCTCPTRIEIYKKYKV